MFLMSFGFSGNRYVPSLIVSKGPAPAVRWILVTEGSICFTFLVVYSDMTGHIGGIVSANVDVAHCSVDRSQSRCQLRQRDKVCLARWDFLLVWVFSVGSLLRAGTHTFYAFFQTMSCMNRPCMLVHVRLINVLIGPLMTREASIIQAL